MEMKWNGEIWRRRDPNQIHLNKGAGVTESHHIYIHTAATLRLLFLNQITVQEDNFYLVSWGRTGSYWEAGRGSCYYGYKQLFLSQIIIIFGYYMHSLIYQRLETTTFVANDKNPFACT